MMTTPQGRIESSSSMTDYSPAKWTRNSCAMRAVASVRARFVSIARWQKMKEASKRKTPKGRDSRQFLTLLLVLFKILCVRRKVVDV
jgi:hypothetical protein